LRDHHKFLYEGDEGGLVSLNILNNTGMYPSFGENTHAVAMLDISVPWYTS